MVNWWIAHQNALTFCLNILELTPVDGPPKRQQYKENQNHRQGYQQEKYIHHLPPVRTNERDKRLALTMTSKELNAMPKPASQAGSHPITAKGTETRL